MSRPFTVEILHDATLAQGGFLELRRLRLRNRRPDDSTSAEYVCDFVARRRGLDAVAVVIFRKNDSGISVLLRNALRPGLFLGRSLPDIPIKDSEDFFHFPEIVAGIIEPHDKSEAAVRGRALAEIREESGYQVNDNEIFTLGPSSFPSAGTVPERLWFFAVDVTDKPEPQLPEGDGSPMEEMATLSWVSLDKGLAMCAAGQIADMKTELGFRRLQEKLAQKPF